MPIVLLPGAQLALASVLLLQPLAGVITQQVGPRHPAIDISCVVGTPVHAAHAGQAAVHTSGDLGLMVVLTGADGLTTTYAHLDSARAPGPVGRGEQIGTCGNTGRLTTGPHLHFGSNRPELLAELAPPMP